MNVKRVIRNSEWFNRRHHIEYNFKSILNTELINCESIYLFSASVKWMRNECNFDNRNPKQNQPKPHETDKQITNLV